MHKHVIAVDDGEASQNAFFHAAKIYPKDSEFYLVHGVYTPCKYYSYPNISAGNSVSLPLSDSVQALSEKYRHMCAQKQVKLFWSLTPKKTCYFETVPFKSTSDLGNGIIQIANSKEANSIVVGSRNLTGTEKFLFGSVSSSLIRKSDKPLLIVKNPRMLTIEEEEASLAGVWLFTIKDLVEFSVPIRGNFLWKGRYPTALQTSLVASRYQWDKRMEETPREILVFIFSLVWRFFDINITTVKFFREENLSACV